MDNLQKLRSGNNNLSSSNPGVIGNRVGQSANGNGSHRSQGQMYLNPSNMMPPSTNGDNVDDLTRNFRGMSLQAPAFSQSNQPSPQIPTQSSTPGGVPLAQPVPYLFNGQVVFGQGPYYAQQNSHGLSPTSMYAPNGAAIMGHGHYGGYNGSQFMDNSPPSWNSSRVTSTQMHSLVTPRRSSGGSSNEPDIPGTPFTQYTGFGAGIPGFDNSPNSLFAYSTPSPSQARFNVNKPQPQAQIPIHLQVLTQRAPAIPKAVPAPFSPTKPLDRRLENPNGITNVYIRGLQPDTTDEMLYNLAKRFGDIESSKAIIDMTTGLCKGFGFVKYYNFQDAEDCIRGFHFCGYETSFARESFYSQLKKLADTDATNLYISNLPLEFNEHDLGAIFEGYDVCSKRILRNPDGSGRGVGFARFATHEVCEQVIQDFNNHPVTKANNEKCSIQIRYADTPEQKALKQQTTAARQYRSAEYESQTQAQMHSPNAFMARFNGHQEFGPYMSGVNGHDYANGYDVSNGFTTRFNAMSGQFTPTSTNTAISVNLPHNAHSGVSAHASSVDDEDKTIHAPITAPVKHDVGHENVVKVESESDI